MLTSLSPQGYTVKIAGADGGTGIAMAEVYLAEDEEQSAPRLTNLSTRGYVASGDAVMIAGFVVGPGSPQRLLIRAAGPTLAGGEFTIGPDHIEVGSFIGLAAVTNSELRIASAGIEHLRSTLMGFARLGVSCTIDGPDLVIPADQKKVIQTDLGGHVPKLEDQPWPAFPADTMSSALVTATQCTGMILFHEKMFESRLFFVDKLVGMGARIVLCDPHRAVVVGPSRLHGAVVESPDIRAGMALLIAAFCAEGESHIYNIAQIERGYERIDHRLRALGARIERQDSREDDDR